MTDTCDPHPEIVAFKRPLQLLNEALGRQRQIKIVAIGSSSTAGEGSGFLSRIGWSWLYAPNIPAA